MALNYTWYLIYTLNYTIFVFAPLVGIRIGSALVWIEICLITAGIKSICQ